MTAPTSRACHRSLYDLIRSNELLSDECGRAQRTLARLYQDNYFLMDRLNAHYRAQWPERREELKSSSESDTLITPHAQEPPRKKRKYKKRAPKNPNATQNPPPTPISGPLSTTEAPLQADLHSTPKKKGVPGRKRGGGGGNRGGNSSRKGGASNSSFLGNDSLDVLGDDDSFSRSHYSDSSSHMASATLGNLFEDEDDLTIDED